MLRNGLLGDAYARVYRATLRDYMPRVWRVYDDVPARDGRLLEPRSTFETYKQGFKAAITDVVDDGADVTIVGGGRGVSAVWCAREGATVTAYEAADDMVPVIHETASVQGVADSVSVEHALVGEAVDVFGTMDNADTIPPSELDTGDVLLLDCEGAEGGILEGLVDAPATVVVETHPRMGASNEAIRGQLRQLGYDVKEYDYEADCDHKAVLVGRQRDGE